MLEQRNPPRRPAVSMQVRGERVAASLFIHCKKQQKQREKFSGRTDRVGTWCRVASSRRSRGDAAAAVADYQQRDYSAAARALEDASGNIPSARL